MRYEHLEWDLSTAACYALLEAINGGKHQLEEGVQTEINNVRNELNARLQRRDQDPQAIVPVQDDWLNG